MNHLLRTDGLTKIYPHRDGPVHALDGITISVSERDFVTITGPSGSGKTTLLLALSGLIRASSGTILFEDKELSSASDKELAEFRKKNVGFIMQNFSLIPYMTASQNIMIPLGLNGMSNEEQKQKASFAMDMVGLKHRINHFPRELSAGQQQRVAIARALVNDPKVIFADEPTGNLDPSLSLEILEFLKNINKTKNITIIMVTHSPDAASYGNVKIHLTDGKVNYFDKK